MRYPNEIPDIIGLLYHAWIPSPDPASGRNISARTRSGGTASTAFTRGSLWACGWTRPAGRISQRPGAASAPRSPAG